MTNLPLPPFCPLNVVQERLQAIFPAGSANRNYCTRDMAAKTVFCMLYVGAVQNADRYLGPKYVVKMSDTQAGMSSDSARLEYASEVAKPGYVPRGKTWYADNSREPIRDETLRQGFVIVGAATERKGVPTSSSKPRYALADDFAALLDPALSGATLDAAILAWRKAHLTPAQLARLALLRAGAGSQTDPSAYMVTFPNGETRKLTPGPSSVITKAVIEEFAPRFLVQPAILWVSESGNKVVARDELLAKKIGLQIDAAKNLPDVILVDLGTPELVLVFVEVVATDGPVSEQRQAELRKVALEAGLEEHHLAFVTAFTDRGEPTFRKCIQQLAWNSFAWLAAEPEHIIALFRGGEIHPPPRQLYQLLPK